MLLDEIDVVSTTLCTSTNQTILCVMASRQSDYLTLFVAGGQIADAFKTPEKSAFGGAKHLLGNL